MTRFSLIIIILCSLIIGSCSSRKNKLDRSNLIPKKELVSILTEIHITDGLFSVPRIRSTYSSLDSTSTYFKILKNHGYTKETMDKTMKYYFIKNPKELIRIYDQVLGILSERESLIQKELLLTETRKGNSWTGKEYYSYPDPSGLDSSIFDLTLNKKGTYTLSFIATLSPDDQSCNPRITSYLCHPDSVETGKRKYIQSIRYIKDGQPHPYSIKLVIPENTILHLRGWFYDFDNNPGEWGKHAIIENISLSYSPLIAL
jgi:hypothetical protein